MILGIDGPMNQAAVIDYMQAKGFPATMDYWSFQNVVGKDPRYWADWAAQRNSDLLGDIVRSLTREHPEEARAWIDANIPPDDPRRSELDGAYALQTATHPEE